MFNLKVSIERLMILLSFFLQAWQDYTFIMSNISPQSEQGIEPMTSHRGVA